MINPTVTKHLMMSAVLAIGCVVATGCGDDDDPVNDTTPIGPGNDAPAGDEITPENIDQVHLELTTILSEAMADDAGTYPGEHSGTVILEVLEEEPPRVGTLYTMYFENYSNDGLIWLNGMAEYLFRDATHYSYTVDLLISGAYSGAVEGEAGMGEDGLSGYWIVDGVRVDFPDPDDRGPADR